MRNAATIRSTKGTFGCSGEKIVPSCNVGLSDLYYISKIISELTERKVFFLYKRRFTAFFAVMTLFNMAASFAHPVTPTIIQNQNMHDYMFGVALGVMLITSFLMSPFWGKITVYISSRRALFVSCLGYAAAQLWFAYSTTELMIILARMFAGLFTGGVFTSFLTYIVNVAKPEDQAKYLTYNATSVSVGGAFGYMVGGLLGEISVRGTFLVQVACILLSGIAFLFSG